jgi:vesicle-fusing ATPase
MDLAECFSADLRVPTIAELQSIEKVVFELKLFSDEELKKAFGLLNSLDLEGKISIGVKKLLLLIETARQDGNKVERFVDLIRDECTKYLMQR